MSKDANFQTLIDMCEKIGWDKGIKSLENIVHGNENLQADLYAGDYHQQRKAVKLSQTIIKQNITIGRLKQYKREHNL